MQWNNLTDAGQLARHLRRAATTPAAANQAFAIVNGDVFRWKWMWSRIAEWFGIEAAPFDGQPAPLEQQMANDAETWAAMAKQFDLAEPNSNQLLARSCC